MTARKNPPIMTAIFTFHNVGQGLFYTGRFGNFSFVYDCGSTRRAYLNSVVAKYRRSRLACPKIDLLMLSHLHDDHIAGLNALLKRPRCSVDTAVLPYLSPIERLMVSLRKTSLSSWLYEFWADPVEFLLERGVRRVLLLGGSEAGTPRDFSTFERRFEDQNEALDISEMPDDDDLLDEVMKKDRQWKRFLDQNRLLTKNHDGYTYRRMPRVTWVFRFFNCRVKDPKLREFEQCVNPIKKKLGLTDLIRDRSKLRQLKGCYEKLHKEFNDTSLAVYHTPITCEKGKILPRNVFGQLLTGDINLKQKWTEIRRHFGHALSDLSLCLVPHHGSKHNWNKAVLTEVTTKCDWIISSGISNRYGHPSFGVIQDIIRNGNSVYWSNELRPHLTMIPL